MKRPGWQCEIDRIYLVDKIVLSDFFKISQDGVRKTHDLLERLSSDEKINSLKKRIDMLSEELNNVYNDCLDLNIDSSMDNNVIYIKGGFICEFDARTSGTLLDGMIYSEKDYIYIGSGRKSRYVSDVSDISDNKEFRKSDRIEHFFVSKKRKVEIEKKFRKIKLKKLKCFKDFGVKFIKLN